MTNKTNNLYIFGDFKLDSNERVLYRNEQILILAPKVFETLLKLVESKGRIISKDDLMNEIWQDSFVEESNLTQNIYTLRQLFGKRNKFIETIPRRGYRFTAEIKTENGVAIEKSNGNISEIIVSRKTTTTLLQEEIIEEDDNQNYSESNIKLLSGTSPKPYFQSRRFKIGLVIGAFATFLLGTVGFFVWQNNFSKPSRSLLEKISFKNLTETGDVENMSISPDGQFLAFVKKVNGNNLSIWLKDIKSKQELPIKLSQDFTPQAVTFSPDGNSIYFLNRKNETKGAEIYKTTRFGGTSELIATNVWSKFSVSPEDDKIAFFRRSVEINQFELIIQNIADKSEKVLITKHFPDAFDLRSSPAWSLNGKEIYAIVALQKQVTSKLVSIDIESGEETIIKTPELRQFASVIALPNSDDLIISAREKQKFPQVYKMNKRGGDFQRLTNDLNIYRDISISKDGKNVVVLQKNAYSHIWLFPETDSEKGIQLTFGRANRDGKHGLDILPDGNIIFTSLEDLNRDLWTVSLKDGAKQQLTKNRTDLNERPFVSNDGDYIYFNSLNDNTFNIERIGINNNKFEKITDKNDTNDFFPNVSPDGKTLYFLRRSKGKSAIYKKLLPAGEESEILLPEGFTADGFLTISPNGKFLAFRQIDEEKRFELEAEFSNLIKIGIIPLDENDSENAKMIEVSTNQSQFRWNNMSDSIFFIKHNEENSGIWKKEIFSDAEAQIIFELQDTKIYQFQFSKDNNLVVAQGKNLDDAVLIRNHF